MFVLMFALYFASDICKSQMIYNRMMPNDPRYFLQRPPVRRSAMEALERLRMPVARYYPQVENSIPSGPYQVPAAPVPGYPYSEDDVYALPPQWSDEFVQSVPERPEEDGDYGNYEYENVFAPVYRSGPVYTDDVYGQQEPIAEPETPEISQLYNDYMVNYLLGASESTDRAEQPEPFNLQRRSDMQSPMNRNLGVINLSNILEANKNATNTPNKAAAPATLPPPTPVSSQVPPQVQMTAVPSSTERKEIKSLVIPEPVAVPLEQRQNMWRDIGQKEEPLFRPLQSSQRTTWDVLSRAKNSVEKRPIPLLNKMINGNEQKKVFDPLTEELNNLKKEHSV